MTSDGRAVLGTESPGHTAPGKNLGRKGTFTLACVCFHAHVHAHSRTWTQCSHIHTHMLGHMCSHTLAHRHNCAHMPTWTSSAPSPERMRQGNLVKAVSGLGLGPPGARREQGCPRAQHTRGNTVVSTRCSQKRTVLQTWWQWLA